MRNEILRELLAEYDQLQQANYQEELRRRQVVGARAPQILSMLDERQRLISDSIRSIIERQMGKQPKGPVIAPEELPDRMALVNQRIEALLGQNGFPADYLDPIYRCKACRDTGYTGEPVREMCSCLRGRLFQRLYGEIGLNEAAEQSFECFDLNVFPEELLPGRTYSQRQLMARAREVCEQWADNYPNVQTRNILLMGQSGLGKTYLMHAMARRLLERGHEVLIMSAYRFLELARNAYFTNNPADIQALAEAEVLMIDDMGTEPLMENITIIQWFNLINERQTRGRGTVISTNLHIDELRERYTERIASRLLDNRQCQLIQLVGEDVRRT